MKETKEVIAAISLAFATARKIAKNPSVSAIVISIMPLLPSILEAIEDWDAIPDEVSDSGNTLAPWVSDNLVNVSGLERQEADLVASIITTLLIAYSYVKNK